MIGKENDIRRIANNWVYAEYHNLNQGFGMIFLTDDLFDDITELVNSKNEIEFEDQFVLMNSSIHELLKIESRNCNLAYIETDYIGGYGIQSSVLYRDGKIAMEPSRTEGTTKEITDNSPINKVLSKMDVRLEKSYNEFESVGLKDIRRMD